MPGWYYIGVNAAMQQRRLLCEPTPNSTTSTRHVAADRTAVEGTSTLVEAQRLFSIWPSKRTTSFSTASKNGWRLSAGSRDRRSCTPQPRHRHRGAARAADHHQQAGATVAGLGKNWEGGAQPPGWSNLPAREWKPLPARRRVLDVVARKVRRRCAASRSATAQLQKRLSLRSWRRRRKRLVEAQKRLLDLSANSMNVNLDVATRTIETMSPSRLFPMAGVTAME